MTHCTALPASTTVLTAASLTLSLRVLSLLVLLLSSAPASAQQESSIEPRTAAGGPVATVQSRAGTTLATQAAVPLVQASPATVTPAKPVLQQPAALPTADAAGICPVIGDFLQDYCTQYPADAACKVP